MPALLSIAFRLNGRQVAAEVAPHENVVEMLQTSFGLTGARESCGQGLCGCCTVLIDGKPVSGCLQLAALLDGSEVVTIEHLSRGPQLTAVQQAFIESGAFQCGFCTSGFILMAEQLLDRVPDPDEDRIRDELSGNLCRCAAYPEIVRAVKLAAARRRSPGAAGRDSSVL